MARLGALLARGPVTPAPAGTARVRRVLGTWQDDGTCEAAMRGLAERLGRRPTRADVTQAGLGGLDAWIRRQGGMIGVARLLGLEYVARPRAGERDEAARAAAPLACLAERYRADGIFPSSMRLTTADARPAAAIARLGGAQAARDALAAHLGVAIPAARRPAGWWTRERVLAILRPLTVRLGRLPTIAEAVAEAGGSSMQQAIHLHGGMGTLRPLLNPSLPSLRQPRGHWERRDVLVGLARQARQEAGTLPTWQGMLRAAGTASVGHGIRRVGGVAVVLHWLAEDDADTAPMAAAA